jgi:hypothetical protein
MQSASDVVFVVRDYPRQMLAKPVRRQLDREVQ